MRVIDPMTPPKSTGRYVYVDPETRQSFAHPYFSSLQRMALAHRRANNLPIPSHWDRFFESNVCENTPTAECEPEETSLRGAFHLTKRFAKEMMNWVASGMDTVDKPTLQARYDVCHGCEYWNGSQMFGTGRCGKCGCSGLKLYLATSKCPIDKWPAIK